MANANDRTKDTEVIRVRGDVYDRVAELADVDERTMGGQVAYLVKNVCAHPEESREDVNIVVAPVHQADKKNQTARVGKNQPYRGFFCGVCGKYVFTSPTETDEAVAEAMNAPLVGVTK